MKTAYSGPLIVYGQRSSNISGQLNNPDVGASLFDRGVALLDGRAGYNVTKPGALGYLGCDSVMILDAVPATLAANNVAASQAPTTGVALTLAAASTGVVVVATGGLKVWASGNIVPAGCLQLDGAPGLLTQVGAQTNPFTNFAAVMFYDPSKNIARNITVTGNGTDTSGTWTVRGYDIYGYPMTETITGAATIVSGKKAFKFVASVTPGGTIASTLVTVGTGDVIGFPLAVASVGYVDIWYNNTQSAALTTPFGTASAYAFQDATTPATATTGDVRGTIYLGTANPSNGTRRIQVIWVPNIVAQTVAGGTFGVTQA